ncbi:MAG: flagellar basal body rod protein FlgC [Aestuariibacter sp.]|nr:flagellar basal body rod protein FlgC [Alteromonadaceae bacterium]MCP3862130.1 flagellar basal body rod protein FlgC [Aestuariibacter sp.]MCP4232614.1 flagellar basal body rod protein FlgC [Aestuariibacter sp.]MCP4527091.1 flagellar basal body rod protein FlgC [Aestuariibacter sp.]MCP4947772.1 flagellar basal body rod protein FlgC [Aestuariibacter sp.]|tara:strand:+ start:114 stop:536 length:423 start_codon:yes stop_codon:yes gene_type:complete
MSLFDVMSISATGMHAESVRLNTTASNIANANTVSSSEGDTYRARHAVFAAELQRASSEQMKGTEVKVLGVVESNKPLNVEYAPNNPLADENGYIYKPNVNIVEEMADMMSASKAYETNIQVADTTKRIFRRVMMLGQGQ